MSGMLRGLGITKVAVFVFLFLSVIAQGANGAMNFETRTVSGFNGPHHIIVGDFNNDTKPDIAVVNWPGNQLIIMLGDGMGNYSINSTLTTGTHPNFIAAGDFDNSGSIDLAVTNGGGLREVTLFFNGGDGSSWTSDSLLIGSDADISSLVAGNFTPSTDSDLDLFIVKDSGYVADFYEVWKGNGSGSFTEISSANTSGSVPIFAVASDFNEDGTFDIAIANYSSQSVTIVLGNGNGTFTQATGSPITVGTIPRAIAAGYLNGDGHVDLAVTNIGTNNVSILLGNGDGTFTAAQNVTCSTGPAGIVISDFDEDGKNDIAVTRFSADLVSLYRGNGDGTFDPIPTDFSVGTYPSFIATDDLDKDGKPDLAVTNYNSNEVTILLNRRCLQAPEGIVSWWSGDGHTNDISGTNHGTLQNGATFAEGKVGQAFSVDGLDDYVSVPYSADLDLQGAFSIDAWVKPQSFGPGTMVIAGKADGYQLYLTADGKLSVAFYDGEAWAILDAVSTLALDAWSHVAGTLDPISDLLTVYINGQLDISVTTAQVPASNANPIEIGGYSCCGSFFKGLIDEVKIYDRALAAEEIAAIYAATNAGICRPCAPAPTGLVSLWAGNGDTNDVIGGNGGTLVNGATYSAGRVDQAFIFDGMNDYVDLPGTASNLVADSEGSLSAWVYPTSLGDNDIVVAFGSGNDGQGIGLGVWNTVRIYHHTGAYDWQSTTAVNANEWTLLTYTWDATTEKIYKNGVFTESRARNFSYVPGNGRIGHGFWGDGANAFPGRIDEVMVFSRTLSAEEVAAIYAAGSGGICWTEDATPDSFSFTDEIDVALNTVATSDSVTVSGINVSTSISIENGEYGINGSGTWTSEDGTVNNGDTVTVRQTSSSSYSTTTDATLTIGGVSDTFSVTTVGPPPIDWANLQWPYSITVEAETETQNIYGQVYIEGITSVPGEPSNLVAEVGYGAEGTDPADQESGWEWTSASYNAQAGNNDEYMGTLTVNTPGTYDYCYRFSYGGGNWVYADLDGTPYSAEYAGKLTVSPSQRTLTVEINPSGWGSVSSTGISCPDDCEDVYDSGTSVELTATPTEGYRFVGWTGGIESADNPVTVTVDSSMTITADFEYIPVDLFVCPSGCDYTSIQAAVDASGPGDTIKVAQGIYYENISITESKEFTLQGGWDSAFTTQTNNPALTVIDGEVEEIGAGTGSVLAFDAGSGVDIKATIENLTLRNGSQPTGGGIHAVAYQSGALELTLLKNVIRDNQAIDGGGIFLSSASLGEIQLTAINNLIFNNRSAQFGAGICVLSEDSASLTASLINNTIADNDADTGGGLFATSNTDGTLNVWVRNTILWGNSVSTSGDDIYMAGANTTVNTEFSDIGVAVNDEGDPAAYTENTNISQNPIFINSIAGDYRLNSDSPCIDAGTTGDSVPEDDFEGGARPQGSGYDIGADEYAMVLPKIRVLTFNGGEYVPAGETHMITWYSPPGKATSFNLSYTIDNGLTWKSIKRGVSENHYSWDVPTIFSGNKKAKIKVVGLKGKLVVGSDVSDAPFTIGVVRILSPNGGETPFSGDEQTITWEINGTMANVDEISLFYTLNGGKTWKPVCDPLKEVVSEYTWTLPEVPVDKSKCKVKIILKDKDGRKIGSDTSDAYFKVLAGF